MADNDRGQMEEFVRKLKREKVSGRMNLHVQSTPVTRDLGW